MKTKKSSDKRFKVETWNGYDIYVDGDGTFFVWSEEGAHGNPHPRAAEAKNIDTLKRQLSIGREVDVEAYTSPRWHYGSGSREGMSKVRIVKVTGLGNMMYRREGQSQIERFGRHDTVYVFDPVREADRLSIIRQQKELEKKLEAHMKAWPRVEAAKL